MEALTKRGEIEIRIGNVDLATKLDALGAAIAAVREAHRDDISPRAWAAMNRAQDAIAEAMLHGNRVFRLGGGNHAPDQKSGYIQCTTPAGATGSPAGNGASEA